MGSDKGGDEDDPEGKLRERDRPCVGANADPVVFRLEGFGSEFKVVGASAGTIVVPAALEG